MHVLVVVVLSERGGVGLGPRPRPAGAVTLSGGGARRPSSSCQYQTVTSNPRQPTFSYQSAAFRIDASAASNAGRRHG